jgi:hypothetical protein
MVAMGDAPVAAAGLPSAADAVAIAETTSLGERCDDEHDGDDDGDDDDDDGDDDDDDGDDGDDGDDDDDDDEDDDDDDDDEHDLLMMTGMVMMMMMTGMVMEMMMEMMTIMMTMMVSMMSMTMVKAVQRGGTYGGDGLVGHGSAHALGRAEGWGATAKQDGIDRDGVVVCDSIAVVVESVSRSSPSTWWWWWWLLLLWLLLVVVVVVEVFRHGCGTGESAGSCGSGG